MNKYQEALDYIVTVTNGADGMVTQINTLQELIDKTQWIPVENGKPLNNDKVLVYLENTCKSGSVYCMGRFENNEFWLLSISDPSKSYPYLQYGVKAWMPLPCLFDEGDDKDE